MPMSPMRSVGAAGETGEVLVDQAADARRAAVTALAAQTLATGLRPENWSVAVSVIEERTGQITAWMATSMGPSYIHMGAGA